MSGIGTCNKCCPVRSTTAGHFDNGVADCVDVPAWLLGLAGFGAGNPVLSPPAPTPPGVRSVDGSVSDTPPGWDGRFIALPAALSEVPALPEAPELPAALVPDCSRRALVALPWEGLTVLVVWSTLLLPAVALLPDSLVPVPLVHALPVSPVELPPMAAPESLVGITEPSPAGFCAQALPAMTSAPTSSA